MEIEDLPLDKKIILFDGVCNLCDTSVQYVIKHDKKDIFRFVALQSELGKKILQHIGINTFHTDSVVLYEPGVSYYYKSDAALQISKNLSGIVSVIGVFKILPSGFRDTIYDYVARNRYKWYGKKESCLLPTAELRSKFLE
ncbi:thiol-disulfide oxidoreductase DCC family protein [Flavobacterium ardleyense]|uniref:Thiol-disulfide oxidoreductase DCC family protein n=1 Tax=Flavobacterium ardleyense TaxID=2038737 RepID=A0ABW5Z5L4_9FLAO